ncbi:MAG: GNAT family N-acetyltransferase [Cellulosilyticaceae bacterium]
MSTITYRPIQKSDYNAVKNIIGEAFEFNKRITNPKFLDIVLSLYLHSCLEKSTFSAVAVKDHRVIGIILGSIPKVCPLSTTLTHRFHSFSQLLRLCQVSKSDRALLHVFKDMDSIYANLISGKEADFGGSIALFAVTSECRGLGIGKSLVHQLQDYMLSQNVQDIYLYTDTICNYGFYESQGFVRVNEHRMTFPTNFATADRNFLDVFLYGYKIPNAKSTTLSPDMVP